jgi:hypothetical protein
MAYYFLYPEKDSTIYSYPARKDLNAGHDEILQITEEKYGGNYYTSRTLVQFKDSEILDVVNNKISGKDFTASLQLFSTENKNLATNQTLKVFPISQSWSEGTGKYLNQPTGSDGVSWIYRDNSDDKTEWLTSSFAAGSTGSMNLTNGGATWYTGSGFETSQSFVNSTNLDTDIIITGAVKKHYSSSQFSSTYPNGIPNDGFIVKRTSAVEFDASNTGELNYFSVDTHTIYPPALAFKWDDSSYVTSSGASIIESGSFFVAIENNEETFNQNTNYKFKVFARDRYPARTFTTSSNYLTQKYLPTSSYYSIRDAATQDIIIPFDTVNTKVSADVNGNYFKLNMKGLQPERYYRILLKVINQEEEVIMDDGYFFKVVR